MKKSDSEPWSTWEFDFVDWAGLEANGSAVEIPNAIRLLVNATSLETATRAYNKLDGLIVNEQRVYQATAPAARCLLTGLGHASDFGRNLTLKLLTEIAIRALQSDEEWNPDANAKRSCLQELICGAAIAFDVLEYTSGASREFDEAMDLVFLLGLTGPELRQRAQHYLKASHLR